MQTKQILINEKLQLKKRPWQLHFFVPSPVRRRKRKRARQLPQAKKNTKILRPVNAKKRRKIGKLRKEKVNNAPTARVYMDLDVYRNS